MANLYEMLAQAQQGEGVAEVGRELGLSPQQTQAAVAALLPALSMGLKRSTATPEGLGNLFALMGAQPGLHAMYDDSEAALSPQGRAAGNQALAAMFGSPDASRAVADQAQQLSGVTSSVLKKLLPVLAGIVISGLMRSGSGKAAPQAPQPAPEASSGGGLGDILKEIFKTGSPGSAGTAPSTRIPAPSSSPSSGGDIGGRIGPGSGYQIPQGQPTEPPTDTGGQPMPGDDMLGQILRELEKAVREGRVKPVVVGPFEIDVPAQGGSSPSGQTQAPGGDIFGQILREILAGRPGQMPKQGQPAALLGGAGGAGAAVFGERLEAGRSVKKSDLDSFQKVLDRFPEARHH
jgi:hypothetical protein